MTKQAWWLIEFEDFEVSLEIYIFLIVKYVKYLDLLDEFFIFIFF